MKKNKPEDDSGEPTYTRAEEWRLTPEILRALRPVIARGNFGEFELALADYGLKKGTKRYAEAVAAWPLLQSELRSVRMRAARSRSVSPGRNRRGGP